MELKELLEKIAEKYLEIDKKSGDLFLLAVLMEEVGELAEAVRKGDIQSIEEELTDVCFITFSIANYFSLGEKLEENIIRKYIRNDPSGRWDLRSVESGN